jgi:hypothetical protein
MKTKFSWVGLLASTVLIAQAQGSDRHGGGEGSLPAPASARPAHAAAPEFQSIPRGNFSGGRFVAPGQRFSSVGMRSPDSFHQQRFVGSNRDAFVSRRHGASEMINHRRDRSGTIGSHGLSNARDHILARRTANWHRDWDRRHDHWWHGHRCRFVNGYWLIFDTGFYPYDYWYPYGYSYYADDYYAYPYSYDPGYYDSSVYQGEEYYGESGYGSSDQYADSTVAAAQERLAQQGYYRGEIDGIFGAATRRAMMRYQSDHGLRVTGRLAVDTLRALGVAASRE